VRAWGQADVTVIDSDFYGSRAGRGGAISVVGASLVAVNTLFSNCTAAEDGGGALSIIDYQCYGASTINTEVSLESCVFENCQALKGGGAIMISGSSANVQTVSLLILSSSFNKYA
jgi:hypothetical protein